MMTKRKYISLFIAVVSLFLINSNVIAQNKIVVIPLNSSKVVKAKTITVPNDFSTIQGAITAANEGDTISILAGTYNETVTINKDNITINGQDKDTTFVSGNQTDPTISIDNSRNITINNLSIRNGTRGISIKLSSVYLTNSKVENNQRGLQVFSNSYINIENTLVNNNTGRGLGVILNTTAYINNSEFNNNGAAGIFSTMGSSVYIQYSKMSNNSGVGLQSYLDANARILECEIKSNADIGVDISGNSTGVLTGHNTISDNADNSGWKSGIGVFHNSHVIIHDNIEISINKGPGVAVSNNSSFFMEGGSIYNNLGDGINLNGDSVGQFETTSPISITGNSGYGIDCEDAKITGNTGSITFNSNTSGNTSCPL